MSNELLLIISIIGIYSGVLIWYYLFGNTGLMCFSVLATIAANIEVLIVINAFGMEQTLGNILFGSTFLITDILSETSGKKAANKTVKIGIVASITFIIISQFWLLYTPAASDWASPSIHAVFSNTPRLMIASFVVYAVTQKFDVWAYHKWWALTKHLCGDEHRFLWLRNNGSTLISQFFNTFLFTFGAFYGVYSIKTLMHIVLSSYVIFIVTSLADTPAIYLARYIYENKYKLPEKTEKAI